MATTSGYFNKELFVLKLAGLSLLMENQSFGYRIYSFVTFIFISFPYPIAQFINSLKYDFNEAAQTRTYDIGLFAGLAKALVVLKERKKVKKVLERLENATENVLSDPKELSEIDMVKTCITVTTAQSMVYYVTGGASQIVIMLLYQVISIAFLSCYFLTIDLITANALCHLSCHFKILQNRISRLVKNESGTKSQNENLTENSTTETVLTLRDQNNRETTWDYLQNSLKDIINYHLSIIEIAEKLDEVFSNLLLFIMLETLTLLCFLIYYTSLTKVGYEQLFPYLSEFGVSCLQILMVCFWGEQISGESQKVALAVSEMDFIGCDLRFQKALTMIMIRGQKPVTLSAGKFATVGLTTFGWIIRSSYSAFVMLKNVNDH